MSEDLGDMKWPKELDIIARHIFLPNTVGRQNRSVQQQPKKKCFLTFKFLPTVKIARFNMTACALLASPRSLLIAYAVMLNALVLLLTELSVCKSK